MKQTFISEIGSHLGRNILLKGWIYNKRFSGKIGFLQVRDGSGFVQGIIVQKDVSAEIWELANKITLESSAILEGTITKHPKQELYELQISDLKLVQMSEEYPIGKKEHGPDFLLDNRHLWLRSNKQWAIQRVRDTIITATYNYFHENDFVKFDTPIITPTSCEGTTELFEMDYFSDVTNNESGYESTNKKSKAYLSQSGQLYLEAGIMSLGRAFDFGPVFRAEKSKTRRHLTEFWMMDAEATCHDF